MLLALAPMQDVTDLAFMRTLFRLGSLPDRWVTPYFRSTRTTCALSEANLRCILENETGRPIWAQLAGSEPGALARDARYLLQLPVEGIQLNAGCPSPLVNRHGAGAALLRKPSRFREVLAALREVVPPGRFSVKCRLGWEKREEFPRLLELLREACPDEVMIHARTRKELYGGTPHPEEVALAVRRLDCPVWGNGDIDSPEVARRWMRETGVAGLALGRGAVRCPYLFRMLRGGAAPSAEEMQRYYAVLMEETGRIFGERLTPAGHCNRMKKYLAFCYPDLTAEAEYVLRRCTDEAAMLHLLTDRRSLVSCGA